MDSKKNERKLKLVVVDGIYIQKSVRRLRIPKSGTPRAMHNHELFGSDLPPPSLGRLDHGRPVLLVQAAPLTSFSQGFDIDPGVLGHLARILPDEKNVLHGLDSGTGICWHTPLIPVDYRSSPVGTMNPVTNLRAVRTIRPMSRTVTPAMFKKGFCQRLQAARIRAGLEQGEVAAALGIPSNTYSKYERRTLMPHHLIPATCDLLGVDTEYLYGEVLRRKKAIVSESRAA